MSEFCRIRLPPKAHCRKINVYQYAVNPTLFIFLAEADNSGFGYQAVSPVEQRKILKRLAVQILESSSVDLTFTVLNTKFPEHVHGLGFELNPYSWSGIRQSTEVGVATRCPWCGQHRSREVNKDDSIQFENGTGWTPSGFPMETLSVSPVFCE